MIKLQEVIYSLWSFVVVFVPSVKYPIRKRREKMKTATGWP